MNAKMSEPATSRLYDLWAKIYDRSFGALVHQRQIRALEQLRPDPGDRILDIGIGTGMTLPYYPPDVRVVGMDLSAGMLAKAREKARSLGRDDVQLVQADAMNPPFAEQSFDRILVSHTVSVVSEPNRLLQWARRLIRPHGRIVVLNHFLSANPAIAWFERTFNPLFVKIGWRSDLSLEECLQDVDLHIHYHFKMSLLDFWQIVVLSPEPVSRPSDAGVAADDSPRLAVVDAS